ncbi:hypothetical protein ACFQDD_07005 [Halorubrum pallidum]|uniref:Uncharacterized protein n=1 Tax=Halorubrum pallidum TaxID=1526114 RepID=A0ABD5T6R4_9EURY
MADKKPNFVVSGEQMPDDGATVGASCHSCGDQFTYRVGEDDPKRCQDCSEEFDALDLVSGPVSISEDEDREAIVSNIEDDQYGVWVDDRVGDIWIYHR